jgi:pyruvate-formate lyase
MEPSDRMKLVKLIREIMRKGAFQMQMNVVSSEILRKAKEQPEQYRNLTVRIAGYSDYFSNLDELQQDEIIARTEYEKL